MIKILIVEDDAGIVAGLSAFLCSEGFEVRSADGQAAAMAQLQKESADLALVDISLTEGNGFALCSQIKREYDLPVIFLTATGDEYSTVAGFDLGADDYILKPFRPRELASRIKNVLRHSGKSETVVLIGDVTVDTERATACKNGADLYLSALEYRLLLMFINNRGATLTRERLLGELWDAAGDYVNDNTLTVYIKRLRDKLGGEDYIKTVRGLGYRLEGEIKS